MGLRFEILRCLKERIENRRGAEGVFESREDQLAWVFGRAGNAAGLFRDPRAALAETILAPDGSIRHPGVSVAADEEGEVNNFLSLALYGSAGAGFQENGASWKDLVAQTCPSLTDPNCWYSVGDQESLATA